MQKGNKDRNSSDGNLPSLGTDPYMGNCKSNAQHSSVVNSDVDQEASISNRSLADEKVAGGPRQQAGAEDG